MTTSSGIIQSFLRQELNSGKKFDDLCFSDLLNYTRSNSEHRIHDFHTSLSFYLGILNDTEKALFPYMKEDQKEQLCFDLKVTMILLLAQQQHEIDYQKTENYNFYETQIKRCHEFLKALDTEYQDQIALAPEQQELLESKPIKYLGISLGHEFGKQLIDLMDIKTKTIKDFMGALNEKRLYWVWGSGFLKTVISLLPEDFFHANQASGAIKTPDPYTGCLSWTLYYFRFSLNLFLLLKHTLKGPWMSEEEAKTPWYKRFQTQWAQRKFTLLNDSLWGSANLLCFFWLNGKSALGTTGDALTVVLLIFDISMAIWDFEEQKTQFNKQILQYDNDLNELYQLKNSLELNDNAEGDIIDEEKKSAQLKQVQMQIHALEREKAKCVRAWQIGKLSLINNIAYAVGLMLAFFVLTMPFLPITAPLAATLGVVGAVVCLAFTVINNGLKGGIELYNTYHTNKEIKAEYRDKLNLFIENNSLPDNERKLLFLEIKQLKAHSEYQKQKIIYQAASLVRRIMLEVLMPALIFTSLVFLPLGIGVATFGAALGLAVASHFLIEALFKPKEKEKLEFNQQEYDQFYKEVNQPEKSPMFFKNELKSELKDEIENKDEKIIDLKIESNLDPSNAT